MHVFTYGTLMFPEVWRVVVGREFVTVRGRVRGYEIYRVCNAVFPGIVASGEDREDQCVRGVLYLDVDEESLRRLDLFEDDFYERRTLGVDCDDGQRRTAETYVVPDHRRATLTDEPWTSEQFVAGGDLQRFLERYAGFSRLSERT